MALPQGLRSILPLIVGLAVGGAGATLFRQSMPGAEGSPEERATKLELELKRANNRVASLEASLAERSVDGAIQRVAADKRSLKDGARGIAEALRAGRPVTPEDIFRASQPLMRDLAPLFDRMRVRDQRRMIDSMTGELARKYALNAEQQEQLRQWFERKSTDNARRWNELLAADGTRLQDMMKASRDVRPDEGLDAFMPAILSGDKLAEFKSERLAERARRVESEADMKVQRLDGIVHLDEAQRDQIFGLMARNSKDYDPQMAIEGAKGQIPVDVSGKPEDSILFYLRPEQRAAYEAEQKRRREEAAKDMEAIGLSLPPDWEMLDDR